MKNSLLFSLCFVLLLNHALAARVPRQLQQAEAFPLQQEALQPDNFPSWLSDWLKALIDWFTNPSNQPFPIPTFPTFPLPPPSQGTPPGPYGQEALAFSPQDLPPWLSDWLKQLIDWLANPTNKPFPIPTFPMFPLPPPSQGSPPVPLPDQEALALPFSPENLPSWLSDWLKQLVDWFANPTNRPFPIPNFPLFPLPPPSQGTPPGPANLEAFVAVNPDWLIDVNLPPWLKEWLKEVRYWCAHPWTPFPTLPWLRHKFYFPPPPSQVISPAPAMAPADSPNSPAPAMAPADSPNSPAPAMAPADSPNSPAPAMAPADSPNSPAPAPAA